MRIAPSHANTAQRNERRRAHHRLPTAGVAIAALALAALFGAYAKWKHWDWQIERSVRTAIAATPPYVEALIAAEPLATVRLDIKFKHLRKIEAKRAEALAGGWLIASDEDYVPASLTVGETSMPVKLRLKGDGIDHWQGDKWSFRIKVKSDDRPFGMRVFSLQHPKSRWYLNEWCFLENLRRDGILAVRYRFVDVVLNGEDKGIYALEEHFDKHLLEAHQRREGVILAFKEPEHFHHDVQLRDAGGHVGTQFAHIRSQEIRVFNAKRVDADPVLRAQADEAIELLRAYQEDRRPAAEVFDVALLGRYYALADLWRASHATFWCNLRYYYNPITARLEPIGYDSMALWGEPDRPLITARRDDYTDNHALRDPIVAAAYLRELERIAQPEYLEHLRSTLTPEFDRWRLALQREFPTERRVQPQWETIASRQTYIRRALEADRHVIATVRPIQNSINNNVATAANELLIELRSIALVPVEVTGVRINGVQVPPAAIRTATVRERPDRATAQLRAALPSSGSPLLTLDPAPPNRPIEVASLRIEVPRELQGNPPTRIEIHTRFVGREHTIAHIVQPAPARTAFSSAPRSVTVEQALARHEFLHGDIGHTLRSARGMWNVHGDLIIPKGMTLIVDGGTTLRFEQGAVLYTTSPVHLKGDPNAPIVLEPAADTWSGVCINGASATSTWRHVRISGMTGITRGGWMLTGGVTFHKSGADLAHIAFTDVTAEDALNVIHANVELRDVEFDTTASDAFDGDFVTGRIERVYFADIGGDGLDVSGSRITARDITARRIVDKVVSVGERSQVDIATLDVATVGMALACKDDSDASLRGADIRNAHVALAAYVKKPQFGPARIAATDVHITATENETLVQTGCSLQLNGTDQPAHEVDVHRLYAIAQSSAHPTEPRTRQNRDREGADKTEPRP